MTITDLVEIIDSGKVYPSFHQTVGFYDILKDKEAEDYFKKHDETDQRNGVICQVVQMLTGQQVSALTPSEYETRAKYIIRTLRGEYSIIDCIATKKLKEGDRVYLFDRIFQGKI